MGQIDVRFLHDNNNRHSFFSFFLFPAPKSVGFHFHSFFLNFHFERTTSLSRTNHFSIKSFFFETNSTSKVLGYLATRHYRGGGGVYILYTLGSLAGSNWGGVGGWWSKNISHKTREGIVKQLWKWQRVGGGGRVDNSSSSDNEFIYI